MRLELEKLNETKFQKIKGVLKTSNAKFGFVWNVFLLFLFGILLVSTFRLVFDIQQTQNLTGLEFICAALGRLGVTLFILGPFLFIISSKFYIRKIKKRRLLYIIPVCMILFGLIFVGVISTIAQ